MYISMNPYQKTQISFTSKYSSIASEQINKVVNDIGNDITDKTLLTLRANLNALKAQVGYEIAHYITMALKGKSNISRADSKLSNVNTAVDECISEIISKEELQSNPKLLVQVLKMKADTLQDIANMLTHKR